MLAEQTEVILFFLQLRLLAAAAVAAMVEQQVIMADLAAAALAMLVRLVLEIPHLHLQHKVQMAALG
jgi:hypothetical protein